MARLALHYQARISTGAAELKACFTDLRLVTLMSTYSYLMARSPEPLSKSYVRFYVTAGSDGEQGDVHATIVSRLGAWRKPQPPCCSDDDVHPDGGEQ